MTWTIWWDIHRHPGLDGRSRATEETEAAAMDRAKRFLDLGFIVYEIRDTNGAVRMDEAQIAERFGRALPDRDQPVARPTVVEDFFANRRGSTGSR